MELINELSAQLTGLDGVLGSSIAFTLKQPKRRKIIARVNTHGKKLAAISRNPISVYCPNGILKVMHSLYYIKPKRYIYHLR
ncbi:MAG: hypothetical protein CM1200mP28_17420 [Deltaproteobacteria bacterium]|nr:MAG: hypothetical protein CM1200mP28_17420 [Deltaproteobacteria bacterium]